ncbi:hypothetical protein BDV98DRAFT_570110 [Pterulicium gracile]|uniref:Uncharacterized protein n=1 Tax=Pterulicium gracile TaxID=1884261 RepID=A0A5C3QDM1_9AGAR|nr:hypothetical protein BDV98DRAFT_570110 [Pterula gracilis]
MVFGGCMPALEGSVLIHRILWTQIELSTRCRSRSSKQLPIEQQLKIQLVRAGSRPLDIKINLFTVCIPLDSGVFAKPVRLLVQNFTRCSSLCLDGEMPPSWILTDPPGSHTQSPSLSSLRSLGLFDPSWLPTFLFRTHRRCEASPSI